MTDAIALTCPNCGAGLGPIEGGRYKCAYCGHISTPPRPAVEPAQRAALFASALSQFESKRASHRSRRQEILDRERRTASTWRSVGGYANLGVGGLFLLFALACFGSAAAAALAPASRPAHHGRAAPAASHGAAVVGAAVASGAAAFGAFWLALGGGLFYLGARALRAGRRDDLLREPGIHGRAVVRSYKETLLRVNGNTRFDLVLEVEVPSRAPYAVKQSDYVPHPWAVTQGADLPVLVDPKDPMDVMIDWYTLSS